MLGLPGIALKSLCKYCDTSLYSQNGLSGEATPNGQYSFGSFDDIHSGIGLAHEDGCSLCSTLQRGATAL